MTDWIRALIDDDGSVASRGALAQLEADMQAMANMRTLDAAKVCLERTDHGDGTQWSWSLRTPTRVEHCRYPNATPDEARAQAATRVRAGSL